MSSVPAPAPARNGRPAPARRKPAARPAQPQPPAPPTPDAAALALALHPDLLPAYAAAGPDARGRFAQLAARRTLLRAAGDGALPAARKLVADLARLRDRLLAHAGQLHDGADAAYLAFWSVGFDPAAGDDTGPAALTAAADALTRLADHAGRAERAVSELAGPTARESEADAFRAALTGEDA